MGGMERFVEVGAEKLCRMLVVKGFTRGVQHSEVIYTRTHSKVPAIKVVVYTSISVGSVKARAKGADAIRVCTIYDDGSKSFGIGKFPKVLRTGSEDAVLTRIGERIRLALIRGGEYATQRGLIPRAA